MIDVKRAAQKAAEYLQELNTGSYNILLEEIEIKETGKVGPDNWLVTLSYFMPSNNESTFFLNPLKKEYKSFEINGDTGELVAMKIKEFK